MVIPTGQNFDGGIQIHVSFHIGFHHDSHDTCSASYHLSSDSWYLYGLISSGYYHGGYHACDNRVHGAFGHNCAGFDRGVTFI